MTEKELTNRKFYPAGEEARFAEGVPERTPQTAHPAYKLGVRATPNSCCARNCARSASSWNCSSPKCSSTKRESARRW